jgi:hypothetical protein
MLTYQTVVQSLLEAVPEFRRTSNEWDADLPNEVFGTFALHLCDAIRRGTDPALVDAGFRFLNEMAESGDEEVVNLLVISVLEILADDQICTDRCNAASGEKVRALLERVVAGWPQSH